MKTNRNALLVLLCVVALMTGAVFGTLAYFTDAEAATNTFTVGSVGLTLDEAKVNTNGTYVSDENERTTDGNEYHLLPGHTYIKDPTVTVTEGSSESYVRMMVTINYSSQMDAIFAPTGADLTSIFDKYDSNKWILKSVTEDEAANTRTYEFRYNETVSAAEKDEPLTALFESFTIPGNITKEQLATLVTKDANGKITDQFTITVVAHAIQAAGFADADEAWTAFGTQHPNV